MQTLIPIMLLIASAGLFYTVIDPNYQDVKALSDELSKYNAALDRSRQLLATRDKLTEKYSAFSTEDLERLKFLLPDAVDNIRLIIDIDNIASHHGINIQGIKVSGATKNSSGGTVAFGGDQNEYGTVELSFSVTTTYDTLLRFIKDLQDSLRLIDITSINFKTTDSQLNDYSITLKTYWLK